MERVRGVNPVTEIWQAVGILSDAQEMLNKCQSAKGSSCLGLKVGNDHINHAKQHLIQALEFYLKENNQAFEEGVKVIRCTLLNPEVVSLQFPDTDPINT